MTKSFRVAHVLFVILFIFSSLDASVYNINVIEPGASIPYFPHVPLYLRLEGAVGESECYTVYVNNEYVTITCQEHTIVDVVLPPGSHLLELSANFQPSSYGKLQHTFSVYLPDGYRLPPHLSRNGWTIDLPEFIDDYHLFWYNHGIWTQSTWRGVKAEKSPSDMWNYQEILHSLKPTVLLEFGVRFGGATLFFSDVMKNVHRDGKNYRILSVDITKDAFDEQVFKEPNLELLIAPSASGTTARRLAAIRKQFPGPLFAILDADHGKDNVTLELQTITPLLEEGDYIIVEDSNLDGHPVSPGWGPSPFDAVTEFVAYNRLLFARDINRELKFGWTQAPAGFWKRTSWFGPVFFPLEHNPYADL